MINLHKISYKSEKNKRKRATKLKSKKEEKKQ